VLSEDLVLAEKLGFNPYYSKIHMNGNFIDMSSNDYLGLKNHPKAIQKAKEAMDSYGLSMCGTPIACGYSELFEQTEMRLSRFAQVESAVIFPSCYQANNGIFNLFCRKNDLIAFDKYCHSSLIQGIFASSAKKNPFIHNDMTHLETILDRNIGKFSNIYVATESVFSTEGAIAPFDEMVKLCKKFGAVPIIDDSHGIGVIGKNGGGVLEYFNIRDFNGIYTASLGKALANSGGMVGGKFEITEKVRYYCPHLIYSTAITPPALGGINGILDVYEQEFPKLSERLWNYKEKLSKSSAYFLEAQAPINSLFCGELEKTVKASKILFEHKILSTPFIEPSVPKNNGVVRLIANAGLNMEQVDKVCEAVKCVTF